MGSGTRHRKANAQQQQNDNSGSAKLKISHKSVNDNITHHSQPEFVTAPSIVVDHHDHPSHHKTNSTTNPVISSSAPTPSPSDDDASSNETTQYGLWLDSEFIYGTSAMSDTYFNRSLSSTEEFQIAVVELWTLTQLSRSRETPSKST